MADLSGEVDLFEDGSDEDAEELTAAEVLKRLEDAWLNEKFAPDLLENKSEVVDCMLNQINVMEQNIRQAKKGDFKLSIHNMEIDRIRYILSSYLRIRLKKIEKYTQHILEAEGQRGPDQGPLMTPEEYSYAREYLDSVDAHLRTVALHHMPQNLQSLDTKQTATRPNTDEYVFVKANEDIEGIIVDEETDDTREEIIDMEKGDQHILPYRPIASLVSNGSVSLI